MMEDLRKTTTVLTKGDKNYNAVIELINKGVKLLNDDKKLVLFKNQSMEKLIDMLTEKKSKFQGAITGDPCEPSTLEQQDGDDNGINYCYKEGKLVSVLHAFGTVMITTETDEPDEFKIMLDSGLREFDTLSELLEYAESLPEILIECYTATLVIVKDGISVGLISFEK